MGLFSKLFGKSNPKRESLNTASVGSGAGIKLSYKKDVAGKQQYESCPNCSFKSGFSAVWTCRECGIIFCTQCLSENDRCPKCDKRNFFQSGYVLE